MAFSALFSVLEVERVNTLGRIREIGAEMLELKKEFLIVSWNNNSDLFRQQEG